MDITETGRGSDIGLGLGAQRRIPVRIRVIVIVRVTITVIKVRVRVNVRIRVTVGVQVRVQEQVEVWIPVWLRVGAWVCKGRRKGVRRRMTRCRGRGPGCMAYTYMAYTPPLHICDSARGPGCMVMRVTTAIPITARNQG